ncbi:hypothetical protein M9H77_23233 [Catharanthus roseus]|uniref:Uncharacterized protein n=1 Tax=Catharanthus roseus TaxID=4058 RepID=A0ACC0ASQ9_CATRO|nr:hypothetical protein M9H77_23233 [Catharanthus roseus]
MAKYGRKGTLLSMVALRLLSKVCFKKDHNLEVEEGEAKVEEDIIGHIQREEDDRQDDFVDKEEGNEDQQIDFFEAVEEEMSLKLKALEDNGMVAYFENDLKSKMDEFGARIKQRNNLEKIANSVKGATLPSTVAPLLLSLVGFYLHNLGREEEKFQLVLKSLSYELNVWWDCKCENRRRMGLNQSRLGA